MALERIQGGRELANALREMPARLARNDLQAATVAGAVVVRDEARLRAPVWTGPVSEGHPAPGTLRKSIILKAIGELSSNERRVVFVTVRHGKKFQHYGKKNRNVDAFYWFWVEFGHVTRNGRTGAIPGGVRARGKARGLLRQAGKFAQAHPFLRPAFEAKKRAAMEAIMDKLSERINAHAKDLSW